MKASPAILLLDRDPARRRLAAAALTGAGWIAKELDGIDATHFTEATAGCAAILILDASLVAPALERVPARTTPIAIPSSVKSGLSDDLVVDAIVPEPLDSAQARASLELLIRLSAAEAKLEESKAALDAFSDQVEQKVDERTASLRDSISQMEEFSYTVSHDLRAPLRSIKGYADVLAHDYAHRLKGEGVHYLERIIESSNRMERLVNDVLSISRISSAQLKLGPVDLQPILQSIVGDYPNLRASVANVKIEALPVVIGHESLCMQVFSNLLTNAAKFVRAGTKPDIRIWFEPRGDRVRVMIQDNGIGIEPEYHEKIFGMFERLDADNRYSGTGIGLAIVRRAVEKMGGRVGVESDGKHGSLFWVELKPAK